MTIETGAEPDRGKELTRTPRMSAFSGFPGALRASVEHVVRSWGRHIDLRGLLCFGLRITLVPFFMREVFQRRKVTIILYHDPDPLTADVHLKVLTRKYSIISLSDFISAKVSGGVGKLPAKSMIVTIDDGFMTNHALLPIFKKYGIRPTIFVCSGIVGTNRHFWFAGRPGDVDVERLKVLPDLDRIRILKGIGFDPERQFDVRQSLSTDEINEMKMDVDFQSHTVFHPCLPRCSTEQASREIRDSRQQITEIYGINVFALSYPDGQYSPGVIRLAKDAGYRCGITVDLGFNDQKTDIFRLKRICLRDKGGGSELLVRVTGVWDFLKRVVK